MLDKATDLKSLLKDPSLLATQAYIAGDWVDSDTGATYPVTNPARGDVIAEVADPSRAQVAETSAGGRRWLSRATGRPSRQAATSKAAA